ncbi:MAG: flagellar biosynthesis anti-sigma factor FlgM [Armatimonadetes bacterium]|nr:flagellar biosynthesis anti-sigma factor FlgM [Armatimonadota bacterium]
MKISRIESGKASMRVGAAESKILPEGRPRGSISSRTEGARHLSPLEKGMAVAEEAMARIPETREDIVNDLKERIRNGEYKIDGKEVADMMLRRLEADRIR